YPDMYTGRGFANAGIAMGLVFGLMTLTYTAVQGFLLARAASEFGREYAEAMQTGSLGQILLYGFHPDVRKSKTADQAEEEFRSAKAKERMMIDQKTGPLQSLRRRLASSKDEAFRFLDIENQGLDQGQGAQLGYFATALFEVKGPGNKEFPESKQYALGL